MSPSRAAPARRVTGVRAESLGAGRFRESLDRAGAALASRYVDDGEAWTAAGRALAGMARYHEAEEAFANAAVARRRGGSDKGEGGGGGAAGPEDLDGVVGARDALDGVARVRSGSGAVRGIARRSWSRPPRALVRGCGWVLRDAAALREPGRAFAFLQSGGFGVLRAYAAAIDAVCDDEKVLYVGVGAGAALARCVAAARPPVVLAGAGHG